jgi:stage V sporulation protein B
MKGVVKAVFTLTFFAIIDRVLGFLFKIYLSHKLGAVNLGIYHVALSVFFVLITLTTSGIPLIVSKLTAAHVIKKDSASEYGTVSAALIVGAAVSLIVCGVFLIFSSPLSGLFAAKQTMSLILLLLPGVLFTGVFAGFRGNMWGRGRYTAVSVIELIEQAVRIGVCVLLFAIGLDKLPATALSMSAACLATAVCCILCYFKGKSRLRSPKGHIAPLIRQSAPVTMIRASNSLVNSLVAIAVPFLLVRRGASVADSLALYGAGVGMAFPLLYIPITVVGSLAYVMIPTLSTAVAKKDAKSVRRQIESATGFAIVVAAVFIPVFAALGEPIGIFVYDNADSGRFLAASAWLLIPVSVENIISSMMNSLDLERAGFINYAIGAAVMFGLMFAFYNSFRIEIMIIGMGVSWTLSSVLDIIKIRKKTGIRLTFIGPLVKSAVLIFPSVLFIRSVYTLISFMPDFLSLGLSAAAGLVFMLLLLLVFGVYDFASFFGRKKTSSKSLLKQCENPC